MSLLTYNVCLYRKSQRILKTQTLTELISEFSKLARYKAHIEKATVLKIQEKWKRISVEEIYYVHG